MNANQMETGWCFDFINRQTAISVIVGYFRLCGLLEFNIKCDDLINIISKYINENEIKVDNDKNIHIDPFDNNRVNTMDCLDKQFIVATRYKPGQLLS